MKKFIFLLVLSFFWCNFLSAKILNIENKIQIEVPSSHKFIRYDNDEVRANIEEFIKNYEGMEIDFYLVGPSKYVDLEKAILDGQDPMDNEYVKSIMKKFERKKFKNEVAASKWMISEAKKIMKKEKVDFITYAFFLNKSLIKLSAEEDGDELADTINELQNMNKKELKEATKEIRKDITKLSGNKNNIPINEEMTIRLNKFNISKNEYDKLFLKSSGKMKWIMGPINLDIMLNLFLAEHNNQTYGFISACYVNCSKFNSKFDKMIKPIFSDNLQINSRSSTLLVNTDIAEQLKVISELYKSGALTKEEFEKAKKRILN
jgi:hypothetical protein